MLPEHRADADLVALAVAQNPAVSWINMVSIVSYGIYGKYLLYSIVFIICISIGYCYHLSYHYIISQW